MSGLDAVASVAGIAQAFHGAAELTKTIKSRFEANTAESKSIENLETFLQFVKKDIDTHYRSYYGRLGPLGLDFRVGDDVARLRLDEIRIQVSAMKMILSMEARSQNPTFDSQYIRDCAELHRAETKEVLDDLFSRLLMKAAMSPRHDSRPPSDYFVHKAPDSRSSLYPEPLSPRRATPGTAPFSSPPVSLPRAISHGIASHPSSSPVSPISSSGISMRDELPHMIVQASGFAHPESLRAAMNSDAPSLIHPLFRSAASLEAVPPNSMPHRVQTIDEIDENRASTVSTGSSDYSTGTASSHTRSSHSSHPSRSSYQSHSSQPPQLPQPPNPSQPPHSYEPFDPYQPQNPSKPSHFSQPMYLPEPSLEHRPSNASQAPEPVPPSPIRSYFSGVHVESSKRAPKPVPASPAQSHTSRRSIESLKAAPSVDCRPRKKNNYLGFCKSAWTIREEGAKGGLQARREPVGLSNFKNVWKCCDCAFHDTRPARDLKSMTIDQRIRSADCGIYYRWIFMAKSHMKLKNAEDELKFGCIFCVANGDPSKSFGGIETLMNHIYRAHSGSMSKVIQDRHHCVVGREALVTEDFDINIPKPMAVQPTESARPDSANTESLLDLDVQEHWGVPKAVVQRSPNHKSLMELDRDIVYKMGLSERS